MALFKILRGNKSNLPQEKTEGYMYITEDVGDIYVDLSDSERIRLNAESSEKLRKIIYNEDGSYNSEVYVDYDVVQNKMDKVNPRGSGSFWLNQSKKDGDNAVIGTNAVAVGTNTFAIGQSSCAEGEDTIAFSDYSHAEGYGSSWNLKISGAAGETTYSFTDPVYALFFRDYIGCAVKYLTTYATIVSVYYDDSDPDNEIGTVTLNKTLSSSEDLNDTEAYFFRSGAFGISSHVEGNGNVAIGDYSHAEGKSSKSSGQTSHAEGSGSIAIGYGSHAEGYSTAKGENTHAEGYGSKAIGQYSHAEGQWTEAIGEVSHTEGYYAVGEGKYSHSEGSYAKILLEDPEPSYPSSSTDAGYASHAEGLGNIVVGSSSHAEGYRNSIFAEAVGAHAEGVDNDIAASGHGIHIEGYNNTIVGTGLNGAHTEGYYTENSATDALGIHVEGYYTTATSDTSLTGSAGYLYSIEDPRGAHVEGYQSLVSAAGAHAEGVSSTASGYGSHSEGYETTASGDYSHAAGFMTTALTNQVAIGHYNNTSTAGAATTSGNGSSSSTSNTLFVIGNGTASSKANAFRVNQYGKAYCKTSYSSTGADYAEYFEWEDLNQNNEDRRGYFVTLNGDKIKIATSSDYVLGVVSALPAIIGNGDEDWMNRYVYDDFGSFIYEEYEYEAPGPMDPETKAQTTVIKTGIKHKENPDYDPTIQYIPREERQEWDAVGMLGVLAVRDDGTCQVNGYCTVSDNGIATASETGYRVIKRVSENVIKIIFR